MSKAKKIEATKLVRPTKQGDEKRDHQIDELSKVKKTYQGEEDNAKPNSIALWMGDKMHLVIAMETTIQRCKTKIIQRK